MALVSWIEFQPCQIRSGEGRRGGYSRPFAGTRVGAPTGRPGAGKNSTSGILCPASRSRHFGSPGSAPAGSVRNRKKGPGRPVRPAAFGHP